MNERTRTLAARICCAALAEKFGVSRRHFWKTYMARNPRAIGSAWLWLAAEVEAGRASVPEDWRKAPGSAGGDVRRKPRPGITGG